MLTGLYVVIYMRALYSALVYITTYALLRPGAVCGYCTHALYTPCIMEAIQFKGTTCNLSNLDHR